MPPIRHSRLAYWRTFRDLRQYELASRSGVPLGTLKHIEQGTGTRGPDVRYVRNLAIALDCELDDILEDHWGRGGWTALPGGPKTPPLPDPDWGPGPPPSLESAVRYPRKRDRDAAQRAESDRFFQEQRKKP